MNSTRHSTPVLVTLTDCSEEDANAVFHALRQRFDCDRPVTAAPQRTPKLHTVWSSTFEVTADRVPVTTAKLSADVKAGLQGGYWAVDRMLETLAAAFDIHDQSTASGDQEKDVRLRLVSPAS